MTDKIVGQLIIRGLWIGMVVKYSAGSTSYTVEWYGKHLFDVSKQPANRWDSSLLSDPTNGDYIIEAVEQWRQTYLKLSGIK